jgi:methylated-DNA-[protein]-cysteine S-methyltransferase
MFWLKFQAQSLGAIYLIATDSALLQISINSTPGCIACGEAEPAPSGHPVLRHSRQQLQEYCRGRLRQLQLPFALDYVAQPFSRQVLLAATRIPRGTTVTYGELAVKVGRPKAARAIGQIMHLNPLPILIPCHRVVGRNQQLVGYAGGVEMKAHLLQLEGAIL